MITALDLTGTQEYLSCIELDQAIQANAGTIARVMRGELGKPADLGWFSPSRWETDALIDRIETLAEKIRSDGELFLLIGVGGSNRGAQSVIETLGDDRLEIIYTGDNLSWQALKSTLAKIRGRSTYLNIIAKDFNTLEPGVAFRFLRRQIEEAYGKAASERIIVTGSEGTGQLYDLSKEQGYTFLPFPPDMGGRFSVISAVGLLPMAVAGVDIRQLIRGAGVAERELKNTAYLENPACRYAVARNLLFEKGFVIESLVTLEPSLNYFARWWVQLFSESEGKNQRCIFPSSCLFSEDLHAIGQYIQEGKRIVMETFLDARFSNPHQLIPQSRISDGFEYLNGKPFDVLNEAVYQAAFTSHWHDGVPCFQFHCGELTPALFGELFYLFMLSCNISAALIGVNPYGQPGVEVYKRNMYRILGKDK